VPRGGARRPGLSPRARHLAPHRPESLRVRIASRAKSRPHAEPEPLSPRRDSPSPHPPSPPIPTVPVSRSRRNGRRRPAFLPFWARTVGPASQALSCGTTQRAGGPRAARARGSTHPRVWTGCASSAGTGSTTPPISLHKKEGGKRKIFALSDCGPKRPGTAALSRSARSAGCR
jgi:hypothetical protein